MQANTCTATFNISQVTTKNHSKMVEFSVFKIQILYFPCSEACQNQDSTQKIANKLVHAETFGFYFIEELIICVLVMFYQVQIETARVRSENDF